MLSRFVRVVALVGVASIAFVGTASAKDYKVGKTAPSGDFVFTVHGFTDPYVPDNQFLHASPGSHFVVVDVEVSNPSSTQRGFSSLLSFHALDKSNRQYNESPMSGAQPPPPDGQIPGKGAIRGTVSFEIPDGTPTPLRFRAQGN